MKVPFFENGVVFDNWPPIFKMEVPSRQLLFIVYYRGHCRDVLKWRSEDSFRVSYFISIAVYLQLLCFLNLHIMNINAFFQRRSQMMRTVDMILLQIVINLIITSQHSRLNQSKEYTRDLLAEHTRRIFDMLRMRLEIFETLLNWLLKNTNLEESKWIDATEKLIMFLVLIDQDLSYRLILWRVTTSKHLPLAGTYLSWEESREVNINISR